MSIYQNMSLRQLRELAKARDIEWAHTLPKNDLVVALDEHDEKFSQPQLVHGFTWNEKENRWVEEDRWEIFPTPRTPVRRVFEQVSVLHTSDETPHSLARAYNLEQSEVITDTVLEEGAKKRGQELGDASGGMEYVSLDGKYRQQA